MVTRRRGRMPRARLRSGLLVAAAVALGVAGCIPVAVPPSDSSPAPPLVPLNITTTPALFPEFDPAITDYVTRCTGSPVQVSVQAPITMTVVVNGGPASTGQFTVDVSKSTGQRFTLVVHTASQPDLTYSIRCLPTDFPTWTVSHAGTTQAEWYLTKTGQNAGTNYPAIFDNNGVPVWWGAKRSFLFTSLLPNNELLDSATGGSLQGTAEHRRLDDTLVGTIAGGNQIDLHDVLLLANGNYVVIRNYARAGMDFSSIGGPASATVVDQVVEEVQPDGIVVWSWDVADHLDVADTDPQWQASLFAFFLTPLGYDAYHVNSIEPTADGYLISVFFHDAVYKISRATGAVVWKLGGGSAAANLTVIDDPYFPGGVGRFGAQHDARLLPDGSLTLFDNGRGLGRAPRVVRYVIDEAAHTATLVESLSDPNILDSVCCGSARRLAGGNWVIGWGGFDPVIDEMTGAGTVVFRLQFAAAGNIMYRALPVPYGQLDRDTLRAAMDAKAP